MLHSKILKKKKNKIIIIIKVKTLALFYSQKISMPLTDLVFKKNGIISLIRYHIKENVATNFGIFVLISVIKMEFFNSGTITTLGKNNNSASISPDGKSLNNGMTVI
jgi:hypothetical protein